MGQGVQDGLPAVSYTHLDVYKRQNEGLAYAKERKQFGKAIIEFPAVYDMLSIMKAKLDAGRALLYQTSRYVDIYKALDDIAREDVYKRQGRIHASAGFLTGELEKLGLSLIHISSSFAFMIDSMS